MQFFPFTITVDGFPVKIVNYPVNTLSELRSLSNSIIEGVKSFYLIEKGKEGVWLYDSLDTTSADNVGAVIVTSSGKRLKRIIEGGIVYPEWFGAYTNGVDCSTEFRASLLFVVTNNLTLYLSGEYLLNTPVSNRLLLIDWLGGSKTWKLTGSQNAKIRTTSSASVILQIYDSSPNSTIENISFVSQHTLGTGYYGAIQIGGYGGQTVKNLTIQNCVFSGFQQTILLNGTENCTIKHNKFLYLKGHDDGSNDTKPNVSIWAINNANGVNTNTSILNNFFDGYANTADITTFTTKRPLDGFVYGEYNGLKVIGNTLKNFAEEGITFTTGAVGGQIIISENSLDGDLPVGTRASDSITIKDVNYHIRADGNDIVISNNILSGVSWGIFSRGFDYPAKVLSNLNISNNILKATTQSFKRFITGIEVNGDSTNKSEKTLINGNVIDLKNSYISSSNRNAISIYRAKNVSIVNNTLTETGITKNGVLIRGISVDASSLIFESDNLVDGFDSKRVQTSNSIITKGLDADKGTDVLVAGTKVINTKAISANSKIQLTLTTPSGTVGFLSAPPESIVDDTSFTVVSTSNADTSTFNWMIIN